MVARVGYSTDLMHNASRRHSLPRCDMGRVSTKSDERRRVNAKFVYAEG